MSLLDRLLDGREIPPTIAIIYAICILCLIYVIFRVVKRKDNYIWIAVAFAIPPVTALMYYLEEKRANRSQSK